jgi:hypothetical protein
MSCTDLSKSSDEPEPSADSDYQDEPESRNEPD